MKTSAYKIYWVEFTAEQGKVVKKDIEAINGRKGFDDYAFGNGKYYKHFDSRESAVNFLKNFNRPLQKKYTCKLLTDKQFGMIKITFVNGKSIWEVPFTTKQNNEIYYI